MDLWISTCWSLNLTVSSSSSSLCELAGRKTKFKGECRHLLYRSNFIINQKPILCIFLNLTQYISCIFKENQCKSRFIKLLVLFTLLRGLAKHVGTISFPLVLCCLMFFNTMSSRWQRQLFVCFQEKQRFLTDVLHEVMLLDGLSSSHPISQEVDQATDIDRVFDWIAYKKVSSLQAHMLATTAR